MSCPHSTIKDYIKNVCDQKGYVYTKDLLRLFNKYAYEHTRDRDRDFLYTYDEVDGHSRWATESPIKCWSCEKYEYKSCMCKECDGCKDKYYTGCDVDNL